jgi:N-acetyl-anhydromuramyl-L-alanine amidase AmpD
MREINKIVIHCSDSSFGNANLIRDWHLERGWKDIGYHYVICNGFISKGNYIDELDGLVEKGRDENVVGAHVKGHNSKSIGICLIGVDTYTEKQMLSLKILLSDMLIKYQLNKDAIFGHRELFDGKTCPTGLDMDELRKIM